MSDNVNNVFILTEVHQALKNQHYVYYQRKANVYEKELVKFIRIAREIDIAEKGLLFYFFKVVKRLRVSSMLTKYSMLK